MNKQKTPATGESGAIVNIGSIDRLDPAAGHGHQATGKAGFTMLTDAAAPEFGSAPIRVNWVSPSLVDRDGLGRDWPESWPTGTIVRRGIGLGLPLTSPTRYCFCWARQLAGSAAPM